MSTVCFVAPAPLLQRLNEAARTEGVSRSDVIRQCIRASLLGPGSRSAPSPIVSKVKVENPEGGPKSNGHGAPLGKAGAMARDLVAPPPPESRRSRFRADALDLDLERDS